MTIIKDLRYWLKSNELTSEEKLSMLYSIDFYLENPLNNSEFIYIDPEVKSFITTFLSVIVIYNIFKKLLEKYFLKKEKNY